MIRVSLQIQPAVEAYNDAGDLAESPDLRPIRIAVTSQAALDRALGALARQLAPLFETGQPEEPETVEEQGNGR